MYLHPELTGQRLMFHSFAHSAQAIPCFLILSIIRYAFLIASILSSLEILVSLSPACCEA